LMESRNAPIVVSKMATRPSHFPGA